MISLDEFRQEALNFLQGVAKPRQEETGFVWGEGEDDVALFEEISPEAERQKVAQAKEWRQKKFDAGFGWITGPKEFGGRELSTAHERLWSSLEAKFDIPDQSPFGIGLGMVAPTIH